MFSTLNMTHDAKAKMLIGELSSCGDNLAVTQVITVQSHRTKLLTTWRLVSIDTQDGETNGWRYEPTKSSVEANAVLNGYRLLLIND